MAYDDPSQEKTDAAHVCCHGGHQIDHNDSHHDQYTLQYDIGEIYMILLYFVSATGSDLQTVVMEHQAIDKSEHYEDNASYFVQIP